MLAVALVVGGVVGVVGIGAANVLGLGEETSTVEAEPSLHIPERTPQGEPDDDEGLTLADLNGGVDPTESEEDEGDGGEDAGASERKKDRKPKKPRSVISLSASPLEVASMERIYLTGTFPGGEGASLQVQRLQGSWTDFPTSTSVSGGTFSTYVMTGQSGPNKFRVVDPASGKKSNPVTVRVR
jgi:hypothetical protein